MLRYLYLVIILSIIFPQGYYGGEKPKIAIITGRVFNNLTSEPVAYASVSVYNEDRTTLVTGGITDGDGYFFIDKFAPGKYSVIIDFMGYETYSIDSININRKDGVRQDLGDIFIVQKTIEVEGTTVISERSTIEFQTDKLVYNMDESNISDSGTAEDALANVPMVTVDDNGNVSLRGNESVKILVNGRENRMGDGPGDVSNIPAALIDKVEVIVSPSAKYDPEGIAGIINIKLKKGEYDGFNGSVKINGKQSSDHDITDMNGINVYGNYRKGKINAYTSIGYNNRANLRDGFRKVDTDYYIDFQDNPDSTHVIDFTYDRKTDKSGLKLTFGSDYYASDYLSLNSEFSYRSGKNTKVGGQYFADASYSDTLITREEDADNNFDMGGSFEMVRAFRNPDQELSFSVMTEREHDSDYKILFTSGDTTFVRDDSSESELDLSYIHPFNKKVKFEIGYDGRFKSHADSMSFELGEIKGISEFQYTRNIHAAYMELDYKLSDFFSIKPSARFEYVSRDISFSSDMLESGNSGLIITDLLASIPDSSISISKFSLYPDLHFSLSFNEGQSIQFGVSRRVERPGSGWGSNIRPFPRDIYTDGFLFVGYPYLRPQYSTNYDISFGSKIPMGYLSANIYYKDINDKLVWYDDDRFSGDITSFRNADNAYDTGIELFSVVMGQVLGGSYNRTDLSDSSGETQLNGVNERISMYSRITLPEKYIRLFGFEFGFYYMKIKVPGGTLFGEKGTLWANTGISKKILNDNATISLSIDNLFNSGGFSMLQTKSIDNIPYGYTSVLETTSTESNRNGRTFKINLKYSFGKFQDDKKKFGGDGRGGGGMDMGL